MRRGGSSLKTESPRNGPMPEGHAYLMESGKGKKGKPGLPARPWKKGKIRKIGGTNPYLPCRILSFRWSGERKKRES